MKMTGEYRIPAPQAQVWAALNDTETLKHCIPGCESIDRLSETEMRATVKAKVGPVSATFKGQVTLSDVDPPNGYTITGEGTGGAAGFAKGGAIVRLATDGDVTVMTYEVNANVGGKLAQIGQRLIDGTAKKMADEFFGAFVAKVGGPVETAAPDHAPADHAPHDHAHHDHAHHDHGHGAAAAPSAGGLPTAAWLGGVITILLALTAFFASR